MKSICRRLGGGVIACIAVAALSTGAQSDTQIERGKYLVQIIGCGDCHTPGGFSPKPDTKRSMAGSDDEIQVTGVGVFVPPNITPDKTTGIGNWTAEQIVKAITTGVRPDGRILSPAMPWSDFARLTKSDAAAIAAYLKKLPPVRNKVPGPGAPKPGAANVLESVVQRR
jgi:mono/diheme cytochrome c family protein